MQRGLQLLLAGIDRTDHRTRNKALHIRRATAKELAVAFGHFERWHGPVLACDRHNIRMPRQQDTSAILWPDGGKQVRLLARFIRDQRNLRACRFQQVRAKRYQPEVGISADRWIGDQLGQQRLSRPNFTHRGDLSGKYERQGFSHPPKRPK